MESGKTGEDKKRMTIGGNLGVQTLWAIPAWGWCVVVDSGGWGVGNAVATRVMKKFMKGRG